MKRHEKASRILDTLEELYPNPGIPLDHKDPYTLLIAVLLSAQSTDKKVNEITPGLFSLADTPAAMAAVELASIREAIRQIGLANTKAKAIKRLSELVVERHQGTVPSSFEALEALPGVGHKTASVVMAQAFGHPAFPVDTHIHRLAARWGLSAAKNVEQTERDLKRAFEARRAHHGRWAGAGAAAADCRAPDPVRVNPRGRARVGTRPRIARRRSHDAASMLHKAPRHRL